MVCLFPRPKSCTHSGVTTLECRAGSVSSLLQRKLSGGSSCWYKRSINRWEKRKYCTTGSCVSCFHVLKTSWDTLISDWETWSQGWWESVCWCRFSEGDPALSSPPSLPTQRWLVQSSREHGSCQKYECEKCRGWNWLRKSKCWPFYIMNTCLLLQNEGVAVRFQCTLFLTISKELYTTVKLFKHHLRGYVDLDCMHRFTVV